MLTYSGNVVVNPWGRNRRGGAVPDGRRRRAWPMFNASDVENLGVTGNETYSRAT